MTLTAYQETHGGREDSKSFPNLVILLWKLLVCSALDSQQRNLEKDLSSLVAKRVRALGLVSTELGINWGGSWAWGKAEKPASPIYLS